MKRITRHRSDRAVRPNCMCVFDTKKERMCKWVRNGADMGHNLLMLTMHKR